MKKFVSAVLSAVMFGSICTSAFAQDIPNTTPKTDSNLQKAYNYVEEINQTYDQNFKVTINHTNLSDDELNEVKAMIRHMAEGQKEEREKDAEMQKKALPLKKMPIGYALRSSSNGSKTIKQYEDGVSDPMTFKQSMSVIINSSKKLEGVNSVSTTGKNCTFNQDDFYAYLFGDALDYINCRVNGYFYFKNSYITIEDDDYYVSSMWTKSDFT